MDCTLIRDMFDNIAADQQAKIHAGVNARQNEIWFSYPDARDGDENSRIVVFNFNESHWASHDGPGIGCWEDGGIFRFPVAAHVDGHIYYHGEGPFGERRSLDQGISKRRFLISATASS